MRIRNWDTIGCAKRDILLYTFQLVMSYVILLVLCIAFFLFPSQHAIREFKKQDGINQTSKISQYMYNADTVLKNLRNMATSLLSEESVLNLAYLQNDTKYNSYYSIIKNLKQINSMYGDQFNQVYIYFHNQSSLLSVTGKLDLSEYYNGKLSLQISRDKFDLLLKKNIQNGMLFYTTDKYLFTVQTLPFNYPDDQYINLIFSIPLQSLFKIPETEVGVPSAYGIHMQDNTVIISGLKQEKKDFDIVRSILDLDSIKTTVSSREIGDNILYYGKSQGNSFKYFFLVRPNTYNEALENYVFYLEISIIFFFLLAGIIIFISVRHQFQPIQKTFAAINSSCINDLTYRECQTVDEYVLHLRNERDTYHDFISKRQQSLKELFLLQLAKGEIVEPNQYQEGINMFNIQFLSPNSCIIIIDITNKVFSFDSGSNAQLDNSYPYIIRNVVTDLLSEYFNIETFRNEQLICCILNIKNSLLTNSECQTLLQGKLLFALDFLKEKANIYCNISVGSFYDSYINIHKSYLEAISCIE